MYFRLEICRITKYFYEVNDVEEKYSAATAAFKWNGDSYYEYEQSYGAIRSLGYSYDITMSLMRWYEYEITVEPGANIINTVTAPIYPSIKSDYNPPIYGYTYLLSPAQTWKSFENLEIVINTPYYIIDSELDGFTKTENGYKLTAVFC